MPLGLMPVTLPVGRLPLIPPSGWKPYVERGGPSDLSRVDYPQFHPADGNHGEVRGRRNNRAGRYPQFRPAAGNTIKSSAIKPTLNIVDYPPSSPKRMET